MDDIAAFIRGYTRDSLPRVRYAGSIDPQNPSIELSREQCLEDDPNLAAREAIFAFLFKSTEQNEAIQLPVANELLHDLFVAHWEFAVGHDGQGHEGLAYEVLQRGLYNTFVYAYTLPLGMDQGCPLELAIARTTTSNGQSPVPELLRAVESLLQHETRAAVSERLDKWRRWLMEKT